MSRPRTNGIARLIGGCLAGITLGASLTGCSDLYLDRRDSIALSAGDAIAANEVEQMIDPWPAQSGNKNVAFNGERMQSAVERYRQNKVTAPQDSQQLSSSASPAQSVTQVNVAGSSSASPTTGDTSQTTSPSSQ